MQTSNVPGGRQPGHAHLSVGDLTAIALHDGTVSRERPEGFIRNAPEEAVRAAFAEVGLPQDKLTLSFTPLALDGPEGRVLIDTGFGTGGAPTTGLLHRHMGDAGLDPGEIGTILISHFHADHIGGLLDGQGAPAFPNARVLVPEPEWAHWTSAAERDAAPEAQKGIFEMTARVLDALGSRVERFGWGDEPVRGITAMRAEGHTPGHTAFDVRSGDDRLLYLGDVTNTPLVFARNPGWHAAFDILPKRAVETRRRVLDAAAEEGTLLFFFHAPFPGFGRVAKVGDRYEYLPAFWPADG